MKVAIWVGYGVYNAYDVSTYEKILALYEEVVGVIESWGMDDELTKVTSNIDKIESDWDEERKIKLVRTCIRFLVDLGEGVDTFEHFEFTELK